MNLFCSNNLNLFLAHTVSTTPVSEKRPAMGPQLSPQLTFRHGFFSSILVCTCTTTLILLFHLHSLPSSAPTLISASSSDTFIFVFVHHDKHIPLQPLSLAPQVQTSSTTLSSVSSDFKQFPFDSTRKLVILELRLLFLSLMVGSCPTISQNAGIGVIRRSVHVKCNNRDFMNQMLYSRKHYLWLCELLF